MLPSRRRTTKCSLSWYDICACRRQRHCTTGTGHTTQNLLAAGSFSHMYSHDLAAEPCNNARKLYETRQTDATVKTSLILVFKGLVSCDHAAGTMKDTKTAVFRVANTHCSAAFHTAWRVHLVVKQRFAELKRALLGTVHWLDVVGKGPNAIQCEAFFGPPCLVVVSSRIDTSAGSQCLNTA